MGCDQTGLTNRFDVREFSSHIGNPDGAPENAGGSGGAKAHHHLRLNRLDLHLQPWTAGLDFSRCRLLMQPALTKQLPFKMFYRVGHITEIAINLRRFERTIQQPAGRTDKWEAGSIFNVTGLFIDEENAGWMTSRPKNRLCRSLPRWASPATPGGHLRLLYTR